MERMTIRDGAVVHLVPAFKAGDFASQNVLHRLADLEDKEENREEGVFTFTKVEIEAIKFALDHTHDADLSFFPDEFITNFENVMDKFDMKYESQVL